MSERQAKRLRRAVRAYIRDNQRRMDNGPKAADAAAERAGMILREWPRMSHLAKRALCVHLANGNLIQASNLAARLGVSVRA